VEKRIEILGFKAGLKFKAQQAFTSIVQQSNLFTWTEEELIVLIVSSVSLYHFP